MIKKFAIFIFGIIVAWVLIAIGANILHSVNHYIEEKNQNEENIIIDKAILEPKELPGEIINESSFKVLSVIMLPEGALVYGKSEYGAYSGTIYFLESDSFFAKHSELYDDKIINVPKGCVARMYGTYKYRTTDGRYKTVPKIRIEFENIK